MVGVLLKRAVISSHGAALLLAGDEALLRQLPAGRWIGGTIPYFMTDAGGTVDRGRIFVDELPAGVEVVGIRRYSAADIGRVYAHLPNDAFASIILPASSPVHLAFGLGAGRARARVFDGAAAATRASPWSRTAAAPRSTTRATASSTTCTPAWRGDAPAPWSARSPSARSRTSS
jgi:hypothetical protein